MKELGDLMIYGPICSPGTTIFFHPQQQAIEDLQSEEEKVNLLTKERAKLQVQAEDVSVFTLPQCVYCTSNHVHSPLGRLFRTQTV